MNYPDPMLRRNVMLVGACISLVLAFATGLSRDACFQSVRSGVNVGTIVFIGYLAAVGFRLWADEFLADSSWPWYARRGAVPLLLASMVFLNAIAVLVIEKELLGTGAREAPPTPACLFLMVAVELLTIPLSDWPMRGPEPRPRWRDSDAGQIPDFGRYPEADDGDFGLPFDLPPTGTKKPSFRPYVPGGKKHDSKTFR